MAVKHYRPYLYGKDFLLRTDHASLRWLYQRKELSHQVACWLETLAEFTFTVQHRAGSKHENADGLSRSCADCKQCSRIEERDGGPYHATLNEEEQLQRVQVTDDVTEDISELQKQPGTDLPILREALDAGRQLTKRQTDGEVLTQRNSQKYNT